MTYLICQLTDNIGRIVRPQEVASLGGWSNKVIAGCRAHNERLERLYDGKVIAAGALFA